MKLVSTTAVAVTGLTSLALSAPSSSLLTSTCYHISPTVSGGSILSKEHLLTNTTKSSPLPSLPLSSASAASLSNCSNPTITVSYEWPCHGFGGCTPIAVTITNPPRPTTLRQECRDGICRPVPLSKATGKPEDEERKSLAGNRARDLVTDERRTFATVVSRKT